MGKKLAFAAVLLIPAALLVRLLWGLQSNRLVEARSVPFAELLQAIPPDLRFEPEALPSNANAWPGMMAAAESARPLTHPETEALDRALYKPESLADPGTMATLEEIFRRQRGALSLAEESVRRKGAALVELAGGTNPAIATRGLQTLTTLLGRRGTVRIAKGEVEAGTQDLISAFRLGQRLFGSGGPVYYATLGSALIGRAAKEIRAAAGNPKLREADLQRLMAALPTSKEFQDAFKRSIRSELYWFTRHEIARLRGPGGHSGVHAREAERRRDIDSGWRELDIIATEVLRGHREPFDRKRTIHDAWPVFHEWSENVDRPWANQSPIEDRIRELVAEWPKATLSGAPLGDVRVTQSIERARQAIAKSRNPYGRLAIWFFIPVTEQNWTAPFKVRAEVEATRLSLALRIYERRTKRLPTGLGDLVRLRLIDRIPSDPFGNGPFRYESAKRRLWSVGLNGTDDGARDDRGTTMRPLDFVFRVERQAAIRVAPPQSVAAEIARRQKAAQPL